MRETGALLFMVYSQCKFILYNYHVQTELHLNSHRHLSVVRHGALLTPFPTQLCVHLCINFHSNSLQLVIFVNSLSLNPHQWSCHCKHSMLLVVHPTGNHSKSARFFFLTPHIPPGQSADLMGACMLIQSDLAPCLIVYHSIDVPFVCSTC